MNVIKVVVRQYGKLFSCSVTGEAAVQYVPGELAMPPDWLARKGFGLFAYASVEDAVGNGLEPGFEVWLAEGIDELPLPPACLVRELSAGYIVHVSEPSWHPHGSRTFRQLRLVRKLWPPDGWAPPDGINPIWVAPYGETVAHIYGVLSEQKPSCTARCVQSRLF